MSTNGTDFITKVINQLNDFRRGAGGNLLYGSQPVFFVAGVDALGAVAYKEVFIKDEAWKVFQYRYAVFFSRAQVNDAL